MTVVDHPGRFDEEELAEEITSLVLRYVMKNPPADTKWLRFGRCERCFTPWSWRACVSRWPAARAATPEEEEERDMERDHYWRAQNRHLGPR